MDVSCLVVITFFPIKNIDLSICWLMYLISVHPPAQFRFVGTPSINLLQCKIIFSFSGIHQLSHYFLLVSDVLVDFSSSCEKEASLGQPMYQVITVEFKFIIIP